MEKVTLANHPSRLVRWLYENWDNWEEDFRNEYPDILMRTHEIYRETEEYSLNGFDDLTPQPYLGKYAIFKYGIGADATDPIVRECRGIIIDVSSKESLRVACWPFTKFEKHDESCADTIDWNSAIISTKYDGALVKLWWEKYSRKWVWSTMSVFYAENAPVEYFNGIANGSIMDLIKNASNYSHIKEILDGGLLMWHFDHDHTYMWELIGPRTQHVVKYNMNELVMIGVRNNDTGKERDVHGKEFRMNKTPLTHDLSSIGKSNTLENVIDYVDKMNLDDDGKIHKIYYEGVVVQDKDFHRIKVKSSIYSVMHGILGVSKRSKEKFVKLLWEQKIDIDSLVFEYPKYGHILAHYYYHVEKIRGELNIFLDVCDRIWNGACYHDRGIFASTIKNFWLARYGFMYIDGGMEKVNENLSFKQIASMVPDYDYPNFSKMFEDAVHAYELKQICD